MRLAPAPGLCGGSILGWGLTCCAHRAWDKHAPEPLGKDHPLWGLMHLGLLPAMKFLAETQQQGEGSLWVGTK